MIFTDFGRFALLIVIVLGWVDSSTAAESVRVRVLHKYHPEAISVWTALDQEPKHVDNMSRLPMSFGDGSEVFVQYPGGRQPRRYKGELLVCRAEHELLIVNVVPLDDYVTSVVLSEMGWKHPEAMKAQAVLARTWVESHRRTSADMYDFGDLTNSQVYKGIFSESSATWELVRKAAAEKLTYHEKPIDVLYYGACSERTFSAFEIWGAEVPYLAVRELPEVLRDSVGNNHWVRNLKKSDVDPVFAPSDIPGYSYAYQNANFQGRLGVSVNGRWFPVDDFRLKVNRMLGWNTIRSNDFSIEDTGDNLVLRGNGFGHLVGMCQQEADILGRDGWNYRQILELFYPGTEIIADELITQD